LDVRAEGAVVAMAGRRRGRPETRTRAGNSRNQKYRPAFSDGRLARSVHTKNQLLGAGIELIGDGSTEVTPERVANRAGKSVSTFYNHFANLDELVLEVLRVQSAQYAASVTPLPPKGPIGPRIKATSHQRREYFEVVGPVLQLAHARIQGSSDFAALLVQHRRLSRRLLTFTFGPELTAAGRNSRTLLDVMEANMGWQNWNALRFDDGHTASNAERLVVLAVTSILSSSWPAPVPP
jgi:AcrR family transcriptional regulator